MKVKLLKKIRKQYSIVYYEYPEDLPYSNPWNYNYRVGTFLIYKYLETKQECLNWILKKVRKRYGRKKVSKGVKVWYNYEK